MILAMRNVKTAAAILGFLLLVFHITVMPHFYLFIKKVIKNDRSV